MELNGEHWLLVYADYVNMLGENLQTVRENTEVSSGGCWDIYMGVHLIRENLTKGIVSNQDYQNLSFHELVK